MAQRKKSLLTAAALVMLALVSSAKTTKLAGKIVGYDLMLHTSKAASNTQNQEVVVLETTNSKQKYVKVMFSSAGTTQIDQKYFDGTQPLEVDALRDHTCNEKDPRFVSQISLEQMGGTYLLTDAYKSHPPGRLKSLECYAAIYKTKKK